MPTTQQRQPLRDVGMVQVHAARRQASPRQRQHAAAGARLRLDRGLPVCLVEWLYPAVGAELVGAHREHALGRP
jgi:hypothetical protein